MNEDLTYQFYQYVLHSHQLSDDIETIKQYPEETLDKLLKVTEDFVKDFLHQSITHLPPQKMKRITVLQSFIKNDYITYRVIGYVHSIFKELNGTPRQGLLAPETRGYIEFEKWINPDVATKDIHEYSHLIILFKFHLNKNNTYKPLVVPPKRGVKTSVFTTRSPHRPNNIGLTISKIEKYENGKLYLKGIDLVEGTPIIDIKPYTFSDSINESEIRMPDWLIRSKNAEIINVKFTEEVVQKITGFINQLEFYKDVNDYLNVVKEVLGLDIRTVHMQKKHEIKKYGVLVDKLNIVFRYVDDGIEVFDCEYIEHPTKFSEIKK